MIPMFRLIGTTICESDGEAEGWTLEIRWLGMLVQFVLARRTGA